MKIDWKSVLIFRNAARDMFTLELCPVKDENVLRVTLKHLSAAEVAAIEKHLDGQATAAKKKKELPLPKVTIALPPGAKLTEQTKSRLKFTVGTGHARAVAESLRKMLRNAGWKEEVTTADGMIGEIAYTKDNQEISLSYVDTGFTPAEFTIRGTRVELERAGHKE